MNLSLIGAQFVALLRNSAQIIFVLVLKVLDFLHVYLSTSEQVDKNRASKH